MNKIILLVILGLSLLFPNFSLAADSNDTSQSIVIENPLSVSTIQEFVVKVLDIVVTISMPFLVVMFIYSGFLFVWARGNETELKRAKEIFFYTVIGAALVLGAFVLAKAIQATIDQLKRQPGVMVEIWRG
ncbi:MAG: hypothetical protein A2571_02060 [Candidatus Vogelbacteria bacterium RIFOXYD1_FULL_44_32]|uniref:Uncharacterized protein n=1 Tax=Candidatus Vogelbacteria bacterium RIFOXYD1_FULL_44_32 TaxID=1802438 RepID=A0A1G2QDL4_9BACT|nr:MAG: hypothetical protein A2571_02060 [Candidatus Vogelbacteria bacterium RIFOXYD1_FULL_44_32]